uniref:Major facilitator superfamily (MFS) profile domain-containing protein n=1 Tax=Globodera rostochiensis TaxID=31243 RepID=A0A914I9E7_GLORO
MDTKQLENLWSLIVAMLFFGAIFGSLLIRPLADRLGRLRVLIVGNLFGAFGLFIGALSYFLNRFELFFLARFGIGFSLALCLGLAGIFLAECSPKGCRGSVSMSTGALLQLGTVFGSLMAIPTVLGSSSRWWAMFTIEGIQLFVTTILLALFAKESPSFLLLRGKETFARRSLAFYHNCPDDTLDERMKEFSSDTLRSVRQRSVGLFQLAKQRGANRKVSAALFHFPWHSAELPLLMLLLWSFSVRRESLSIGLPSTMLALPC